jgi:peptidoglycan/xylan/chitin deacetylase (PgdA/CDA1 family)
LSIKQLLLKFLSYRMAERLKTIIALILYFSGAAYLIRVFLRKGASILVYHSISHDGCGVFCDNIVHVRKFEEQISFLKKNYKIVPLTSLIERLQDGGEVPSNWVVLTFDDGYKDNVQHAAPLISKYKIPATMFIITGVVLDNRKLFYDEIQGIIDNTDIKEICLNVSGRKFKYDLSTKKKKNDAVLNLVLGMREKNSEELNDIMNNLRVLCGVTADRQGSKSAYLSEEDLAFLTNSGIEIGSHTKNHRNLITLTERELNEEIKDSKKILDEMHSDVTSFSYPFGKRSTYNLFIKNMVKHAGYTSAVTTNFGKVTPESDRYELPRIGVRNTCLTRLKVSLMGIPL